MTEWEIMEDFLKKNKLFSSRTFEDLPFAAALNAFAAGNKYPKLPSTKSVNTKLLTILFTCTVGFHAVLLDFHTWFNFLYALKNPVGFSLALYIATKLS